MSPQLAISGQTVHRFTLAVLRVPVKVVAVGISKSIVFDNSDRTDLSRSAKLKLPQLVWISGADAECHPNELPSGERFFSLLPLSVSPQATTEGAERLHQICSL